MGERRWLQLPGDWSSQAGGALASHPKLPDTYHFTSSASVSRMLWAVRQLKRTNWGKPNTGSTCFLDQALVLGSGRGRGGQWESPACTVSSKLLSLASESPPPHLRPLPGTRGTHHCLRHLPVSRPLHRLFSQILCLRTGAQGEVQGDCSQFLSLTSPGTTGTEPAFVEH